MDEEIITVIIVIINISIVN